MTCSWIWQRGRGLKITRSCYMKACGCNAKTPKMQLQFRSCPFSLTFSSTKQPACAWLPARYPSGVFPTSSLNSDGRFGIQGVPGAAREVAVRRDLGIYSKDKTRKREVWGWWEREMGWGPVIGTHPRRQKKWRQSEAIGKRQNLRKTGFMSPTAHRTTYLTPMYDFMLGTSFILPFK